MAKPARAPRGSRFPPAFYILWLALVGASLEMPHKTHYRNPNQDKAEYS
jgi:hypothetical protein